MDLLQALGVTGRRTGTLTIMQSQGVWAAVNHYFQGSVVALLAVVPSALLVCLQYLGAAVFVLSQARLRGIAWGPAGWLAALTILLFLGVPGPAAEARFRLPVESFINAAAGAGLVLAAGFRTRRQPEPVEARPAA